MLLIVLIGLTLIGGVYFTHEAFAANLDVTPVENSIQLGCEKQTTGCFIPKKIEVNLADTITFRNQNTEFHYFVSGNLQTGPTNVLNTGLIYPGDSFRWHPTSGGDVEFFCMIHPWLASTITINDSPSAKKNTELRPADRVTICHIPPGNPDNPISITISSSALNAHLAHGDALDMCPAEPLKKKDLPKQKDTSVLPNDKVTICHIPPGNPDNPVSITISVSALDAHTAHGDTPGQCPMSSKTNDNTLANDPTVSPDDTVLMCHVSSGPQVFDEQDKSLSITDSFTICHIPPGNPDNQRTINVDGKSIKGHLAHGDKLEACTYVPDQPKTKEKKKDSSLSPKDQVTICHIPPGNPDNPVTITLAASALDAHINHGDNVGECAASNSLQKLNLKNFDDLGLDDKVTICHVPPGNPDNPRTINVSVASLATHVKHGDDTGSCPASKKTVKDSSKDMSLSPKDKVTICHVPPGNPDNPRTITVDASSLDAHFAHNDYNGACQPSEKSTQTSVYVKASSIQQHLAKGDTLGACQSSSPNNKKPDIKNYEDLDPTDQVTICHIPPGNPDNPVTITVDASSLGAHFDHGDSVDTCPESKTKGKKPDIKNDSKLGPDDQVTICHIPPGNPDNPVTITVDASSIDTHISHGDYSGTCAAQTDSKKPDNKNEEPAKEDKKPDPKNDKTLAPDDEVYLCHIPPGNPDNPVTIQVGLTAVDAHLAHGDSFNACNANPPSSPPNPPTPNNPPEPNPPSSPPNPPSSPPNPPTPNNPPEPNPPEPVKVTICHIPPGNPDNPRTITVDASALDAHSEHGDYLGACKTVPVSPPPTPLSQTLDVCDVQDPNNPQIINIQVSELSAHLGHGDYFGTACPYVPPTPLSQNVDVCDVQDPNNPHKITVQLSELPSYLERGDYVGVACPYVPPPIPFNPPEIKYIIEKEIQYINNDSKPITEIIPGQILEKYTSDTKSLENVQVQRQENKITVSWESNGQLQNLMLEENNDRTLKWTDESNAYLKIYGKDEQVQTWNPWYYIIPIIAAAAILLLLVLLKRTKLVILGAFSSHHPGNAFADLKIVDQSEINFSSLLLGVYDKETEKFVTTCVTQTKFTEEQMEELHKMLVPRIISEKPENVHSLILPDMWFVPECAVSAKIDKMVPSKEHTARRTVPDNEGTTKQYPIDSYVNNKSTVDMTEKENGIQITELKLGKFHENVSPNKVTSSSKLVKIFDRHKDNNTA